MKTLKLSAPATRLGVRLRFKHSAIGGFWRRLVEFRQVYRLYRRAAHSPMYCARIAFGIAFKGLPF